MRATSFILFAVLAACGHDEAAQAPTELPTGVTPEPTATTTATASATAAANTTGSTTSMASDAPMFDAGFSVPNAAASIARLRPGFRACYNKGLAEDPTIAGKIIVSIKVAPNGDVDSVSKVGGSGLPAKVEECMLKKARQAVFEPSGGSGTLQVPILFVKQDARDAATD